MCGRPSTTDNRFTALLSWPELPTQKGASTVRSLPNIVLVHGAFADGSSWSGVIELLQAEGYKVSAPQLREGLAPLLHPRSPAEAIQ